MFKTGIILQVRTGSCRLPNKSILPFYKEKTITEIIIERIQSYNLNTPIVLATTLNKKDDPLIDIAKKTGVFFYRGEEDNVLKRFIDAANYYSFDYIVRVCGDNPLIDVNSIKELLIYNNEHDYLAYSLSDGTPTIRSHYGFWSEKIKTTALEKIQQITTDKIYLEHVTNYIYTHPKDFNIRFLPISNIIESEANIRLTIDNQIDFNCVSEIYKNLLENNIPMVSDNIIKYLEDKNEMKLIMKHQIINNSK